MRSLRKLNRGDLIHEIYKFVIKTYMQYPHGHVWIIANEKNTPEESEYYCKMGAKSVTDQKKVIEYCQKKSLLPVDWKPELWSQEVLNNEKAHYISFILEVLKEENPDTSFRELRQFFKDKIFGGSKNIFRGGYVSKEFPFTEKQPKKLQQLLQQQLSQEEADVMCRWIVNRPDKYCRGSQSWGE